MKSPLNAAQINLFIQAEEDVKEAIKVGNMVSQGILPQTQHAIEEIYYIIRKHQVKRKYKNKQLNAVQEVFDEFFKKEGLTDIMLNYVLTRCLLDESEGKSFVAQILALDDDVILYEWLEGRVRDAENKEKEDSKKKSSSEKPASETDSSENVKEVQKKTPSKKTSKKAK